MREKKFVCSRTGANNLGNIIDIPEAVSEPLFIRFLCRRNRRSHVENIGLWSQEARISARASQFLNYVTSGNVCSLSSPSVK